MAARRQRQLLIAFTCLFLFYTLYHLTVEERRRIDLLRAERILELEQEWDLLLSKKEITTFQPQHEPILYVDMSIRKMEAKMLRKLSGLQESEKAKRIEIKYWELEFSREAEFASKWNETLIKMTNKAKAVLKQEAQLNPMSYFQNITLGEPVARDKLRHIILAADFRTGSSFLGELLSQIPGTYYNFEPLFKNNSTIPKEKMELVKDMHFCNISEKFIRLISKVENAHLFLHNKRLMNTCQNYVYGLFPDACVRKDLHLQLCKIYPIRLSKLTRAPLEDLSPLFSYPELGNNLHMIFLVRDPRAVIQSRSKEVWCTESSSCIQPKEVCNRLQNDLDTFIAMQRANLPVYILRYEDLSLDMSKEVWKLFHFLDINIMKYLEKYLKDHTTFDKDGSYLTQRNTKSHTFAWRNDISWNLTHLVQEECQPVMDRLGYLGMSSEENLRNPNNTLLTALPQ